jgi:two-component system NtrC family sensor kinase
MHESTGIPHVGQVGVTAGMVIPQPRDGSVGSGFEAVEPSPLQAARLALVARHTDDAIVIYGADGRIDWVNDAFVRTTGFSLADVVGARRMDLVRGPFTRTEQFAEIGRDLTERRGVSAEFVTRTKDGVPYWVAMQVRPAAQEGRVVAQIGVERDITPRRQAEERARQTLRRAESLGVALRHEKHLLSAVLGTIPHLVWWKGTDLRFVGANPAYLSFRGLSSVAEVVGRLDSQLDVDDGFGAAVSDLEQAVADSHQPIADSTICLARPGGPQWTFLLSVLPYYEGQRFAGVIGIGADVGQVADLERQLAQASRLESIGQLAAGIAHEINTPVQYVSDNTRFVADTFSDVLTGLREITKLVEATVPGAAPDADALRDGLKAVLDRLDLEFVAGEVPSALTACLEGLERVGGIVKAMKDFSHPGQGRTVVDLNRVVETTVQVCRSEWKYVAELVLDFEAAVGQVPCFEGELKQVLLNVLVNAAQAIEARRTRSGVGELGRITVGTRRRDQEALIVIEDDGIGMDEATRLRVFDPFFTTKDVGRGTGQGLSLAHAIIVQKHGGRIEVDSTPGQGARFTVALPLTMPDPPDLPDPPDVPDPTEGRST